MDDTDDATRSMVQAGQCHNAFCGKDHERPSKDSQI